MHHKTLRLYSFIFPFWLLWLLPMFWIFLAPAALIWDILVVLLTLKFLKQADGLATLGQVIWRVWLCGFASTLAGAGIMYLPFLLSPSDTSSRISLWQTALSSSPFSDPLALLWTILCIAVSGVLIYILARRFTLRRAALPESVCKKLALSLAVFTAPYLFLLPIF